MKFIHLSDLHIGKRLHETSFLEDQEYILKEILGIIAEEKPQGVIIAGDVYDKPAPSNEAVRLFDDFLTGLARLGTEVFVISGNHDSAERIAFGGRLLEASRVHMSPVYDGNVPVTEMTDEYGKLTVRLLPFIKPVHVRACFPEEEIVSYTDAVRCAIAHMEVDPAVRNLLVTHQFVTGAGTCDSEEVSVGGTDNVDAAVFEAFDYVALGHLHRPQDCGSATVRYCGTPLKYSFSEAADEKSVTVAEFGAKGEVTVRTVPLRPKRDLVELRGSYDTLMSRSFYEGTTLTEDYVRITLTDEQDVPDALAKLRCVYKNVLNFDYDNTRSRANAVISGGAETENKSPLELFAELFLLQNGREMSAEQNEFVSGLIEKIKEDRS